MCDECAPLDRHEAGTVSRRTLLGGTVVLGTALALGASDRAAAGRPSAVPVADGLSIRPREAWAKEPPKGPMKPEDVRFLLVHHTAGVQPSPENVATELRSIYRFHTGLDKGWPDVCYNFFIDPHGGVWEGRAGSLAGPVEASATGGSQGFAQLVCLLGDFTSTLPTAAALSSLQLTLAWLAGRYGIDMHPDATVTFASRGSNLWPAGATVVASTVSGHRDMSRTACPGDTFYPYLTNQLRASVHTTATGQPFGTTPAPPAQEAPTTSAVDSATTSSAASSTTSSTTTTSTATTTTSPTTTTPPLSASTVPLPSTVDGTGSPLSTPSGARGALPSTVSTGGGERSASTVPDESSGIGAGSLLAVAGLAAAVAGGGRLLLARRSQSDSSDATDLEPGGDE